MPKRVVLLASGTRGDILPYIALAEALKQSGYMPVLATHENFRQLVLTRGLEFFLLDGNPSELMTRPGGQSANTFDGRIVSSLKATLTYIREAQPLYARLLNSAYQAARDADVIIAGLPTIWVGQLAQALRKPLIWAFMQPVLRTNQFHSALLPITLPSTLLSTQLSYWLVEQATWYPWRQVIKHWHHTVLGSESAELTRIWDQFQYSPLVLNAYSRFVVPKPADWPANTWVTGYWFLDPDISWQPPPELVQYLNADLPTIGISFGSPGMRDPVAMGEMILNVLNELGVRAVVDLPAHIFPFQVRSGGKVFIVNDIPHSWLLPRLSAIIHHGGAGTTAASLRAGIPSVVAPLAVDQFFWANRLHSLGLSPPPIPQRTLSESNLKKALQTVLINPEPGKVASQYANFIQSENGLATAISLIQMVL